MLLLAACLATGCASRPIDQPVETALSASTNAGRRVAAVGLTPDARSQELMPLVTSSRHPFPVRRAAVDRMIQADADAFWGSAWSNIRRIDDWPMITLLSERAAADRRLAFAPGLIESWARPSTRYDDAGRPEREALRQLFPAVGEEETLWAAAASVSESPRDRRTAVAAWTVLCRILPPEDQAAGVAMRAGACDLMRHLHLAAQAVTQLPRDREALLRLETLREASGPADWARRGAVRLTHAESPGPATLALRHLPAIDHTPDADLEHGRADRLRNLNLRLAGIRRISRGTGTERANIRTTPDTLNDHADKLGWADLLVTEAVLDAMQDRALIAVLFEQAEHDRQDIGSEHGGVLTWDETGRVVARSFEPMMRRHDEIYIASDGCIEAMHTGLTHYHFHAQRYDNAQWAGPGGGDFRFANNLHANCVVFTFIDRDTLNVDLYFPGEVVIDLGCVQR